MLDDATIRKIAAIYAHEEYRKYLEVNKDVHSLRDKLSILYSHYKAAREYLESNKETIEY